MPAVYFKVSWPDGETSTYYSPSTVIREHFRSGDRYELEEFAKQATTGLNAASERVREKFGYYCSAAADTLAQILRKFETLRDQNVVGTVQIVQID